MQRHRNRPLIDVRPHLPRALQERLFVDRLLRLKRNVDDALIANFSERKIVGDQANRRNFVPRWANSLFDVDRTKSILFHMDFPGSVISERNRDGRVANRLVIDGHESPFRLAADYQATLNAAGKYRDCQNGKAHNESKPESIPHAGPFFFGRIKIGK